MRPEPPDKSGKSNAPRQRREKDLACRRSQRHSPRPCQGAESSRWFRGLRAAKSSGPPPPAKIPGAASRRGFAVFHDPPLKRRAKIRRSLRDLRWRSSPAAKRYTFGIRAIFLIGVTILTLDSHEIMGVGCPERRRRGDAAPTFDNSRPWLGAAARIFCDSVGSFSCSSPVLAGGISWPTC